MAKKHLHVLITERRMDKLRLYAAKKDKTVTAIIEELLDTLPELSTESVKASAHDAASIHL